MTVLIIIVAVLVVAYLLYLGNRARDRRRLEAARRREKLGAEAEGHRSMAGQHEQEAEELREAAESAEQRAARHQERAVEVDPEIDADADATEVETRER
jgi:hypothetical protein